MKKITLLFFSFLLFAVGGVKAQNLSKGKSVIPIGDLVGSVTLDGLKALTDGVNSNYYNFSIYNKDTEETQTQSWYVDLESQQAIGHISIYWEGACATTYKIYGGNNTDDIQNDAWGTLLVNETDCQGGAGASQKKEYSIEANSGYRYIKFKAEELFNKEWGCKMGELVVTGTQNGKLVSVKTNQLFFGDNIEIIPQLTDEFGETFKGTANYTCDAEGFSAADNVLTFKNTPEGTYTINIKADDINLEQKVCIVRSVPEEPTITENEVKTVFCDKYSSKEPTISDPNWNDKYTDYQKIEIASSNYAYLVHNAGTYGLNGGGYADAKYLLFDIFVTEATTGSIKIEGTNYNKAISFESGKWNNIILDLSSSDISNASWIQFYLDRPCDIMLDNVLYTKREMKDDGEDPVILRSLISGKSVASATLRLQAYDNCGEVTFKVDVRKDGEVVQTIDNIKAKSEEFVRLIIQDLDINTRYTATVTATDLGGRMATTIVKGIGENEDFFVTERLPLAIGQKPTATKYYYLHGEKDLRGGLGTNNTGWGEAVDEIETDEESHKAIKYTFTKEKNVYGLCLTNNDENEFAADDKSVTRIAIYPVEFEDIEVAPRYYGEADQFEPRKLTPNTWNYISVAPHHYTHTNAFIGVVFRAAAGSRVFIDNFCRYTSSDVTAPEITDFKIIDRRAESVKLSFHLSDVTGEGDDGTSPIKYEIYAKKDDGSIKIIGSGSTTNPGDVTYYARGLKGNTDYTLYVMAKDKAENRANNLNNGSQVSNFKYENKISLEEVAGNGGVEVFAEDKGGKVVIKPGRWDIDVFNAIAAKYPYGCFDLRNVIFPDKYSDKPEDEGKDYAMNFDANDTEHGLRLFNHNAYIIVDRFNSVNANYAVPTKDDKLQGMNFNWYDGDFTISDGPNRALKDYYQKIVDDYKAANNGESYPGLTRFGYIKCDPYIGETVQFEEQGAAMTRQMFTDKAVSGGTEDSGEYADGQKANKYSTIICPFPLSTENIKRCEFYQLTTPNYNHETNAITLNFTKIEGITKANTPYLIKVTGGIGGSILFADAPENTKKQLSFEGIEYDNTLGKNLIATEETTSSSNDLTVTLYGTYTSQNLTNVEGSRKFYGLKQGNGEKLTLGTAKKIDFPAFRAMVAISGPALAASKSFNICFDGEVTGITEISNEAISAVIDNVYSIDGKKMGNIRNGLINLPAGIYIVNGKKVVIK